MYAANDTIYELFVMHDETGSAANADSMPTATLYRNNEESSQEVTVTSLGTGIYALEGEIPYNFLVGDVINIVVNATLNGVNGNHVVKLGRILDRITNYSNHNSLTRLTKN